MIRAIAAGFLFLTSAESFGQAFEVASIKIHPGPASVINITTSGLRFRADAEMVGGLVMYAYNLKNYQLSFKEPNSIADDLFFDVEAKAEGDSAPTKDEFRQMMRSLLAERFKVKVHHEMREMPVFALVVGKNGPKFKESASDAVASGRHTMNGRNQVMTLSKATMDDVSQSLGVYADRPVVNKTGLAGAYEIKMEATPFFRINRDPDPADISVFAAGAGPARPQAGASKSAD